MWLDRFRQPPRPPAPEQRRTPFQPRATRFYLDVPVAFLEQGHTHQGHCLNVSTSGLLAKFTHPPEIWTGGQISLESGGYLLDLHVRVARLQGNEVGFAFLFHNESDHATINVLIDSVSHRPLPGEVQESAG